jgi:hypothetical protein
MKRQRKNNSRGGKATNNLRRHLWQFGIINTILNARKCYIYECLINPSWIAEGLARILFSRKQPNGNFVFGVYLVDTFCLGLKNTFCNANFSLSEYKDLKEQVFQDVEPIDCSVNLAHQIIYGAIKYASKLGFKPHKDFDISKHILDEEIKCGVKPEIEFGKNGKPFFIAGPDDNAELIVKKLEERLGAGNFAFVLPSEH